MNIDLFCRVIDNFGDAGVCWRLSRQLCREYDARVRLIVDVLTPFAVIAPEVDQTVATKCVQQIEIVRWDKCSATCTADLVIEAFACDPPDAYVNSMAARLQKPVWINLEYLSAEAWVDGVHGLPSPHPKLPLVKYFFVPGFTQKSGGLIRDREAMATTGITIERSASSRIRGLAFTYPHAPVRSLATAFESAGLPLQVSTAAPLSDSDATWSAAGPVPQTQFDALLTQFDLLLVRGEDSFLRAQYAGKPMLWHIYPTEDRAHLVKLDAWLDHYCAAMPAGLAQIYRAASHAFVDTNLVEAQANQAFAAFADAFSALELHAIRWREMLFDQSDLATRLMAFFEQKARQ